MASLRAHLAAALVLLVLPMVGRSQNHPPAPIEADIQFERLDGLSHNSIVTILQDHEGFLWVGTPDGLNRYDGYGFTVFRHDPADPTSLSNNFIKALLEDWRGNLWIGTDGGLHRYDRSTERFIRNPLGLADSAALSETVHTIYQDDSGQLWMNGSGLYRYDPHSNRIHTYRHVPGDPHSLASDAVWSIFQDNEGILWTSTYRALNRFDAEADHFERFPFPDGLLYATIQREEGSLLWLSGVSEWSGAFDRRTGRYVAWPIPAAPAPVFTSLEDRNGRLWFGTTKGLFRFENAFGYVPVRTDPSPGTYLQNHISTLYEDRTGTLWAGTLSGLYRLDPHAKPFHHLTRNPADPNSLSNSTAMAVLEDRHGVLWVGTLGGGLNRVDRRTGRVTRYQHRAGEPGSLCNDLIWSLHEDPHGKLWIGTDQGLCVLDHSAGRFISYLLPLGPNATTQPAINDLLTDRHGQLWIAAYDGLYSLDPRSGSPVKRFAPPNPSSMAFSSVQSLYESRDGTLWFGFFGGKLYHWAPEAPTPEMVQLRQADGRGLSGEGVWAIHEDTQGTLWLGSDQGLTRLDPATGRTEHITQADGLPGSIVYAILEDRERRLWLSTNQGLARVEVSPAGARRFRHYQTGDGVRNTEFNRRAVYQSASGEFYFGGLEGLTSFFPEQIRDNPNVPPVVLTNLLVASRDTTRSLRPPPKGSLRLSYRDYAITFEFAALNFTNPAQNRYAYRLDGFDQHWIDAGTRRLAHYTNLPPGEYTFRVRGSNDDGLWNEAGAALAFVVTPPFWQTWWFRLLLTVVLIAALVAADRYRVRRLLEIERMRLRIASDLHDDIGSNLSSIALLSDMVRDRHRLGVRERRQLSRISRSARSMVDALRDIVWSIDPEADRTDDLVRRMQDAATTLLGETRWTFDAPANGLPDALDMDLRRHVFLGYKEMLHNVARHAEAGQVTIRLARTDGTLELTVADDGVGFDAADPPVGTGLKSLRERAAHLGGTLSVETASGSGTTIRLRVPLRRAGHR